jgi:tetratricopeptide (TPR) repeat protein
MENMNMKRTMIPALAGLLVTGALFVPSGADAQGQCITASSASGVTECPSGGAPPAKRAGNTVPRSQLRSAAPRAAEEEAEEPSGPGFELDVNQRANRERGAVREADLLTREVRVLKRLVQNTRANNPQRPEILLRLAETYFEMQQSLNGQVRSFDERIFQSCQRQKNRSNCREARGGQQQAETRLEETRNESIRTYAILVRDHPDFPRMDEVLFSLAFGLEELRQHDRARQVYHRLIKGFPQSRFIPHAYLSFAEYYFSESDMRAALRFYDKVTDFPPERNPVYGYALYKSAWAHYNEEDFQGALRSFVQTIEFATANPDATDATNLARQARRELVLPYAMVGRPGQALEFFRRYATNNEQALEMLESLAELYFDTGQWSETIGVYHELMSEGAGSDKLCYWQSRVTNAVVSSRPKDDQVTELRRLVDVFEAYTGQNHPAESITQCKSETAGVLAWLATSWHREAIGDDNTPGTNDRTTMRLAARLYEILIDKFPDMEELEFDNIARDDWPTNYKVSYYFAELLWKMEDWARCGPAFDSVVELNPQGEFTGDAAYAAVLCYNNLYQQQYSGRERETRDSAEESTGRGRGRRGRRAREAAAAAAAEAEANRYVMRDFTELETGMLNAFQRYVCFVPDSDDLAQIKYRRARIYYEANHFQEAAVLFKDIAWNHRDSEMSEFAANLYLDSLNVMGSEMEPNRVECLNELETSIDPLTEFYCATQQAQDDHPDLCGVLLTLKCNVMRKQAEAYHNNEQFKRAAAQYVRIFRRHQECAEEANFAMDEVLYNAAIDFEAARLLGRAIQVRNVLIERFPESQYSKRAIYLVGANFHALAFYEQAAGYYERFARQFPGESGEDCSDAERENGSCAIAHEALQQAVFFRIGLGDTEEAVADATLFERSYKRSLPRQTSQVVFAVGSIYERSENWTQVVRHYRKFLRDYRRQGLPHQLIRANVLMGTAHRELEQERDSIRYYQAALALWERAPAAINELDDVTDTEKILYIKQALDSTAEALFYLAEEKYREFRAIRFPRYSGGRNMARVQAWAQGDFAEWLQEKTAARVAAEGEYNQVAALSIVVREGVPALNSPPWQIAAAARVGQMYRSFVDDFRDAPIPSEIENDEELYSIYVDALEAQANPLQAAAVGAFEFCLRTATNVRWFNEWSTTCEQELNGLDASRYPIAAELRGAPNFVRGSIGRPGPVELQMAGDEEPEELAAEGGE